MRIDRFLGENTDLSRTLAKRALKSGEVTCNGEVIKSASFHVDDTMHIQLYGETITALGTVYLMINKPVDTVCSNTGDASYPSVLSLLDLPNAEQLTIAGRLDADTTGLVLVTSDGQWNHRITSPKKAFGKRYRVQLDRPLEQDAASTFQNGILLRSEDKPTLPADLELLGEKEALLTIHEGRYHQVKRMFAAIGNHVVGLHREQVGEITLDPTLEPGEWRMLTEQEIASV